MSSWWQGRWQRLVAPPKRLMAVAFLIDLSGAIIGLSAQFLAIGFGAEPLFLGLLGMSGSLAYTLGCLIAGGVSDRIGRRIPAVIAGLVAPSFWLLMGKVTQSWQLLILTPLASGSMALLWPSTMAWLSELVGDNRRRLNRSLSLFNMAWSAGMMLGPLVAGYTWGTSHYLPFAVAGMGGYLCVLILLRTPLGHAGVEAALTPERRVSPRLVQQFLLLSWIGNFATWFCRGSIANTFPKLGASLEFPESLVGILLFVLGASQVLAFALARLTDRWQFRLRYLVGAEAVGLVGMLIALFAHTPAMFVTGFILAGACSGVTYISSLTYALQGSADSRGQLSGFHEAVLGMGVMIGPLVGGLLAQYFTLHTPYYACAAMFGLAMLVQAWLWNSWGRPRLVQPPAAPLKNIN